MNKKQKKRLRNIIIAGVLFVLAVIVALVNKTYEFTFYGVEVLKYLRISLYVIAYIVVARDILKKCLNNLKRKKIFDENFLMIIATIGAFILGEFPEAVAVIVFYEVGELFQSLAVNKSRRSIASLLEIRPDYANLKKEDGQIEVVSPYDVHIGDVIQVKVGEKIPLDGVIIEGSASVDTSALTGESRPRTLGVGDTVLSAYINLNSIIYVRVEKEFLESSASKIIDMVENASSKKSKTETFISSFAKVYTPIVVFSALMLAFIPPIFYGFDTFFTWVYRALAFLVVSCPCALVVSVPLSFFAGIGASSKIGVLVKGSNFLEVLSKTNIAVFDKTGTLTKGSFELSKINTFDIEEKEALYYAYMIEMYSAHPIAKSIKVAYESRNLSYDLDENKISNFKEITGLGVSANIEDKEVLLGNSQLLINNNIDFTKENENKTVIYLALNKKFVASFIIEDKIKEESKDLVKDLNKIGIENIVMLSGDDDNIAKDVAKTLGINKVFAKLLPKDKLDKVEDLLKNKDKNKSLIFVGDGINDAPVLARADAGVAMGALGTDAAIEAADIVIMNDDISKLTKAIKLSKRTIAIASQNIFFALFVKVLVLLLTAIGITGMWTAVFADVGVSVIAIFNAMRNLSDIK